MNGLPGQANGYGQPGNDHASSRTEPGNAERLTGIYGSEGWRFESLRARQVSSPFRSWKGLLANAGANSGYPAAFMIRAKMSAASASWLLIMWAYTRRVIDGPAWPSRAATTCTWVPASSRVVAWT